MKKYRRYLAGYYVLNDSIISWPVDTQRSRKSGYRVVMTRIIVISLAVVLLRCNDNRWSTQNSYLWWEKIHYPSLTETMAIFLILCETNHGRRMDIIDFNWKQIDIEHTVIFCIVYSFYFYWRPTIQDIRTTLWWKDWQYFLSPVQ